MKKLFDPKAKIVTILLATLLITGLSNNGFSQGMLISASAGTADGSAMLDIVSTNRGLLSPRMTTAQRNAISAPAPGLLIYNTDTNAFNYYNGGSWITVGTVTGNGTVTGFSAGTLSPLFTTSVTNASTTPSLSFSLSNAGSYTILGNNTVSATTPSYFSPALASALFSNQGTISTVLHGNAAGNPSWGSIALGSDITGTLGVTNGGTGATTLTGYVKGTGTSALTASATIPGTDVSGNISGNAANVTGTVAVANGGTGATTLTGYVKGAGTSALTASATIPASDVSGNISGNAVNVTGTVAVANGGTGATTLTGYMKGTGTSAVTASATIPGTDVSGNISGNAANVTGTVAVANGGTGQASNLIQGGIVYGSSTTAMGVTVVGAAGEILQSNGTGAPTWSTSTYPSAAGNVGSILSSDGTNFTSGALSNLEAFVATDVTLTTAGTFYDGPSISLAPGTWLINGTVTVASANATSQRVVAKLWNGTTVESSTEGAAPSQGGGTKGYISLSLSGIVTITVTAAWKISVTSSAASSVLKAATGDYGSGNNASSIRAVRVGP